MAGSYENDTAEIGCPACVRATQTQTATCYELLGKTAALPPEKSSPYLLESGGRAGEGGKEGGRRGEKKGNVQMTT